MMKNGNRAYAAAQEKVDQLGELKGTLAKSGKDLYEGLTKILAVKREVEKYLCLCHHVQ